MDFSVLGPLQVRVGGQLVPVRRGLPRLLLIYLLLHPGEPIPAAVLADRVWNGQPPADAGNAVHRVVSYLRRTLGAREELLLHTTSAGYVLDVDPGAVDSNRFAQLVHGAGADPADSLPSLDDALALWRGEPLADAVALPWSAPYVTELEELHLSAQERRLAALLELGRHAEAVPAGQALVAAHPLREGLRMSLMLALYRSGRQSDALAVAASLRRTLADELGLDPSPAVVELERRILTQDPLLAPDQTGGAGDLRRPSPAPSGVRRSATGGGERTTERRALLPPHPVTSLVGREQEVAAVTRLFEQTRLLTLTGPGGTGKTRLALALLEQDATTPVWFADLSGAVDDATVASIVAAATGAPTAPGADVVDAVVAHLAGARGVLVLDTCEHVVCGAAAVTAAVVHGCPLVRQLATSRRPLGISAEVSWPVPPLTLPPATDPSPAEVRGTASGELFAQRARAVRPDFDIDETNAADVAAICRALDGLPLAIELAAAHVDVLSPAQIRRRLDDRFALLVSDARDVAERQRTLRAVVDSSVALLTPAERSLFAHLSVFAGVFDVEAAIAVAPRSPDLTDNDRFRLLVSLLRQSLIARVGQDRYRLLDSVRAYAAELLDDSPAVVDVRRRHAEYHAAMAQAGDVHLRTDSQRSWMARLSEAQPDFRAALRWCLEGNAPELGARMVGSLAWFWTLEGQLAEARYWLDRAERVDVGDPGVRARVLLGVGLVAAPLGHLRQAQEACAEAADLCRSAGDDRGTGDALITLGVALWALGDLDAAAAAHEEAIERFEAVDEPWRRNVAVVLRARTAVDRTDDDAAERVAAALVAARRTADAHLVGLALTQQARLALREQRADDAVAAATEALSSYRRIGYHEGEAAALTLVARGHVAAGDGDRTAADAAGQALEVAAAINHRGALCSAVETLAAVRAADGEDGEALVLLEVAAIERRSSGIPDARVEAGLTGTLAANLRARLGAQAVVAAREAAALTVEDVAADLRHRTRLTSAR